MYCSSTVTVSEVNYSNDRLLDTVDGRNPVPVDMVVYPIIYRVLYIPSGAGFLPTVPSKSEQILVKELLPGSFNNFAHEK